MFWSKSNTFRFFRQKYTFFFNVLGTNSIFFAVFFNYNYFRMVYTNSILFELNQNQIIFLIRVKTVNRVARKWLGSGAWDLGSEQKASTGGLGSEVGSGVWLGVWGLKYQNYLLYSRYKTSLRKSFTESCGCMTNKVFDMYQEPYLGSGV